ncbi:MAG TPA: dTDP-4-dehydrorhamnose 3,5-epimerase family protein [Candidatus Sulfotelmatobacter sp.]|nr:dTDP-4-dehydrorhamnose 3,5-epimerase family protein [Candidatus Sulfotelmatobacter sp.]
MEFITLANIDSVKLIKDVVIHPYKVNKDASGILVETLRKDWEGIYGEGKEFFMQYYSETPPGLARDEDQWHYHPTVQDDRFSVVKGEIVVAIADNREGSETIGILNLFYIKARENPYMVLIPKKTLHGFMVVSKESAILINFPTNLYNPEEEGRIPYKEVNVKTQNGEIFSWDLVRNEFPKISS